MDGVVRQQSIVMAWLGFMLEQKITMNRQGTKVLGQRSIVVDSEPL